MSTSDPTRASTARASRTIAARVAAGGLVLCGALAQERGRDQNPPEGIPIRVHQGEGQGSEVVQPSLQDDAQREMVRLFGKVERQLRRVDVLLSDAGAGDTSALARVGPAGIDELLRSSLETGRRSVEDIDRILELAQQLGGSCQGGGTSAGDPQNQDQDSSSPLDRGRQTTQREDTPEDPAGERPGGQERQPDGDPSRPESSQGRPESPLGADDPERDNEPAADPPALELGGRAATADSAERWGDLPVHVRDIFRYEGGDGLPPQYRDWIDSYYRRLNESPRER